jgi:hypothetical protein
MENVVIFYDHLEYLRPFRIIHGRYIVCGDLVCFSRF